jgi:hypothetical protein
MDNSERTRVIGLAVGLGVLILGGVCIFIARFGSRFQDHMDFLEAKDLACMMESLRHEYGKLPSEEFFAELRRCSESGDRFRDRHGRPYIYWNVLEKDTQCSIIAGSGKDGRLSFDRSIVLTLPEDSPSDQDDILLVNGMRYRGGAK